MLSSTVSGYIHEVGFYDSDADFRALIVPFAHDSVAAAEPLILAYDTHKTELLHDWLDDLPDVEFVTEAAPYANPAKALASWRGVVQDKLAAGARRVRIAGDVPHPGYGIPFSGWDRYEAAFDRALGHLPIWAPCLYDTRIAPTEVIEAALSSHRLRRDRDGRTHPNDRYRAPARLSDFAVAATDPLELTEPAIVMVDPTPETARHAVGRLLQGWSARDAVDSLVVATSETVTNAWLYGRPPVTLRLWVGDGRAVVHVSDTGEGPTDPLIGLLPPQDETAESGRGLWITHQLDLDVTLIPSAGGFAVRFSADLHEAAR